MVCWLGLFRAEEILASSLLAAMPAELVKPACSTHESEQETVYNIHCMQHPQVRARNRIQNSQGHKLAACAGRDQCAALLRDLGPAL